MPNFTNKFILFNPNLAPKELNTIHGNDTSNNSYVFSRRIQGWYAINPSNKQWVSIQEHQVPPEYKLQLLLIQGN